MDVVQHDYDFMFKIFVIGNYAAGKVVYMKIFKRAHLLYDLLIKFSTRKNLGLSISG